MKHVVPMDVAGHDSLGSLLDEALVRHGSKVALLEANRRREVHRLTYLEVDRAAAGVAHRLRERGIGPGDRVAILMTNQSAWLITAIAVFRCGAVLVPLDFKLEPDAQCGLLEHADPCLLVTEYAIHQALRDEVDVPAVWVSDAPRDRSLGPLGEPFDAMATAGASEPFVAAVRGREDLATIVYSSGTGGRAKGCMLSHGAYLTQLTALLARFPMEVGDRYLSVLPTNHAIDFMVGFVGPLVCGASVVHQRTLRPELIRWTMRRYGISHMAVVPMLLQAFRRAIDEAVQAQPAWRRSALAALTALNGQLTKKGPRPAVSRALLRPVHERFGGRLRLLFCGGAFTDRALAEGFYALGIPAVIGYGLTEACTVITLNGLQPFRADSVGRALPGVEVRIHEADANGVGEVCVRGPSLMSGYLDDPELTAQTLRDGWLYTGDLGWMDASSHLHLVGRIKDVIVTAGGKNVYPEDVEHAFAEVGAEEVAVFAANTLWPVRSLVNEELVAVLRPREGAAIDDAVRTLFDHNRGLAEHKRVSGVLVWEQPFPRTASMKLKRLELVDQVAASASRTAVVRP